jgi:ABC-type branched-subunit amino acid transport system permease subunit
VRLSGVYLTMLTLAFAQISWAIVFQWDDFTGGSNGLTGVWPPNGHRRARRSTGWLWASARWASICCAACCFRRWAMRCAHRATRRCGPMPSASTCAACSGRRS